MKKSINDLKKEIAGLQMELEERLRTKNIPCECGRSKHYEDAEFCSNCGTRLEDGENKNEEQKSLKKQIYEKPHGVGGVVRLNKLKEGQTVELFVTATLKEGVNGEDIPEALFTPSGDGFGIRASVLEKIDICLFHIRARGSENSD